MRKNFAMRHLSYRWMFAAVMAYPLSFVSALYSTWGVAWLMLGHPPRPSLDDPKSIGWLVSYYETATYLLALFFPFGLFVSGLGIVASLEDQSRRGQNVRDVLFVLAAGSWIALICLFILDPGGVIVWFMD